MAQPLGEERLRLAGQVPLPRLRLSEKLHKLLITCLCGILEIGLGRLGPLECVIQDAHQSVRGILGAGGLLSRRCGALWAGIVSLLLYLLAPIGLHRVPAVRGTAVLKVKKSNLYAMTFRNHTRRLGPLATLAACGIEQRGHSF